MNIKIRGLTIVSIGLAESENSFKGQFEQNKMQYLTGKSNFLKVKSTNLKY
jgi:hypothetical protein